MKLKEKILQSGLKQKFVAKSVGLSPEHFNLMLNEKADMPESVRNKVNELLTKVSA